MSRDQNAAPRLAGFGSEGTKDGASIGCRGNSYHVVWALAEMSHVTRIPSPDWLSVLDTAF